MNARRAIVCALLCLPAVLALAFGAYLLRDKLPRLERQQRASAAREYRTVALALAEEAAGLADVKSIPREKGWRIAGRLTKREIPWGHQPAADGRECVWIVPAGTKETSVRAVWVEAAEASDELAYVRYGVPATAVIFCLVTVGFVVWYARSSKARDDFMAATAHDLTTPLVGMRYMVGRDAEAERLLVERMLRLVANLKDFLRLGGRPRPHVERVDLKAAYDEAYALFRDDYRDLFDGADVAVAGADGLPCVRGDATLVVQVFWNLLANDLKYAAPHGRVDVAFSAADGFVSARFCDAGPGMTPRQRRHAFDRYYRAAPALRSGKGGFGIGLCTARDFVRAMGGDLTVAANAPRGCVFTMRLPAWT